MPILIDILEAGVIDSSGNPLDSGKVYVYEVGTTTPVDSYQDIELSLLHPNPIILDSVGKVEAYVNQDVRLVIETSNGVTVSDIDALGSNTALQGGITILGQGPGDVVIFNSSIQGDLIPTVDDTYDVGSETKRWAEGHFDELNGNMVSGLLKSVGANTPGWTSNIGSKLDSGTFKVVSADGSDFSEDVFGYITAKSITPGLLTPLKVTYSASFDDVNGANPSLTGVGFGIDESNDLTDSLYLYVANRLNSNVTGIDGDSVFFVTRSANFQKTPSDPDNIGDTANAPVDDDINSMVIMGNVTTSNYVNLPCTRFHRLTGNWDAGDTDWEIPAPDSTFNGEALTPNEIWENVERTVSVSGTAGVRGVAISTESGLITETTTTPQDIGVSATITTSGRPVFIGLISDSSSGGIEVFFDSTGNICQGRVSLLRDGVTIYSGELSHTAPTTSLGGILIPPSSIWTIDPVNVGTYEYTCAVSSLNTDSTITIDDVKIVVFEL